MMKIAVFTLLGIAAANPATPSSAAPIMTTKTTVQFARCFTDVQDRGGNAWWFVPKAHGGTISNLGAPKVLAPYFLAIEDRGNVREIKLSEARVIGAHQRDVSQCL